LHDINTIFKILFATYKFRPSICQLRGNMFVYLVYFVTERACLVTNSTSRRHVDPRRTTLFPRTSDPMVHRSRRRGIMRASEEAREDIISNGCWIYIILYVHTYIIYIYIHTHTHIYIYIYIYIFSIASGDHVPGLHQRRHHGNDAAGVPCCARKHISSAI